MLELSDMMQCMMVVEGRMLIKGVRTEKYDTYAKVAHPFGD